MGARCGARGRHAAPKSASDAHQLIADIMADPCAPGCVAGLSDAISRHRPASALVLAAGQMGSYKACGLQEGYQWYTSCVLYL